MASISSPGAQFSAFIPPWNEWRNRGATGSDSSGSILDSKHLTPPPLSPWFSAQVHKRTFIWSVFIFTSWGGEFWHFGERKGFIIHLPSVLASSSAMFLVLFIFLLLLLHMHLLVFPENKWVSSLIPAGMSGGYSCAPLFVCLCACPGVSSRACSSIYVWREGNDRQESDFTRWSSFRSSGSEILCKHQE